MPIEFIRPWMKKCNPDLIIRFWRKLNCPGQLTTNHFGVKITRYNTLFGEIVSINHSLDMGESCQ